MFPTFDDYPISPALWNYYLDRVEFMRENVRFAFSESLHHTFQHCAHVLYFALILGFEEHLSQPDLTALAMAAYFHDSRRMDDGLDTGHGARAAEYYYEYCRHTGLPFDSRSYLLMRFHDLDDTCGTAMIRRQSEPARTELLFQIFKDADALDRLRLGDWALDPSYLRRAYSKDLIPLARTLNLDNDERTDNVDDFIRHYREKKRRNRPRPTSMSPQTRDEPGLFRQ